MMSLERLGLKKFIERSRALFYTLYGCRISTRAELLFRGCFDDFSMEDCWTCEGYPLEESTDSYVKDPYAPSNGDVYLVHTSSGASRASQKGERLGFHLVMPCTRYFDPYFGINIP